MAINVTKPAINLREKLNEVTLETGIKGEELLNSDTSTEARNVLELDTHLFTDFESTGIDDNATSTAITIDASEKVGIGTTSPATKLHINDTDGGVLRFERNDASVVTGDSFGTLEFYQQDASDQGVGVVSKISSVNESTFSGVGALAFSTGNAVTLTERMRIDSAGNVEVKTGNLVIGTSGKGIDFSAATPDGTGTVTSEVLDDYEEGTWTPTISGQTTSGTGTYSEQSGTYTKVGNKVTVNCALAWSAHTGTGNMRISGQPFTTATGIYAGSLYYSDFFVSATADDLFVYTAGTRIDFRGGRLDGSSREVVTIDTAGTMYITITYLV